MDRWALYTSGKISKPTQNPQLLRLETHGDFVIELPDNHPPEGSELCALSGSTLALESVAIEDALGGPCSELNRPGFSCPSHVVNRRREKQWHENCRPGTPPLVTLQAAVGGFALGVVATAASVVLFWQ